MTPETATGADRLCICRGVLFILVFHSSFMEPTLAVVKIFSFFSQPVRRRVGIRMAKCQQKYNRPSEPGHASDCRYPLR